MSLMIDEIRQQPAILERMVDKPVPALARLRSRFESRPPPLVVIAARGTSDHAALLGRYLLEVTLGIPTSLAAPSVVTVYGKRPMPPEALVIGISQSGESTDINSYMDCAKSSGCITVGITNEPDSTLAGLADEVLPTQAGKEASVAATKTYTAQIMMICLLARSLGARLCRSDLQRVSECAAAQLAAEESIAALAEECRGLSTATVVGRGFNYANAFEFSLKLMETSYVVATGYSAADFEHGPIAMIEEGFSSFAFVPPGPTAVGTAALVERLAASKADVTCIGADKDVRQVPHTRRITIRGPLPVADDYPEDILTPIPFIVPAQLFAAYLAASKGFNPDQPRMLSKVTRTM